MKVLKRHLMTDHGLTPEEYRAKWGLRPDYPMVAATYSAQRQTLAKQFGLGRKPATPPLPEPEKPKRIWWGNRRVVPARSIAARAPLTLWAGRLSRMTMSPGARAGARKVAVAALTYPSDLVGSATAYYELRNSTGAETMWRASRSTVTAWQIS